MEWLSNLITPTALVFEIIIFGYFLGKVSMFGISLDYSGILIVAFFVGMVITRIGTDVITSDFQNDIDVFTKFGMSLFVSSIGISIGYTFLKDFKKGNFIYIVFGIFMVIAGFAAMQIIVCLDHQIEKSLLNGILCGSLTSTPGLAAAAEFAINKYDLLVTGYSSAYFFGVIGVVLFVQIIGKRVHVKNEPIYLSSQCSNKHHMSIENFILLSVIVIIGYILGQINIPLVNFSIGNTGGIMCSGIVIGLFLHKNQKNQDFSLFRNLGLMLFLAGTGISSGMKTMEIFHIRYFLYGSIITLFTIIIGYVFCRLLAKRSIEETLCVIAGGMTSTPALGVMIKNKTVPVDLSAYSMTYAAALLTIILLMRIGNRF